MANPITMVTAADTTHAESMRRMVLSFRKYVPTARVVTYDLGMTTGERSKFESACPWADLRKFPYNKYPPYFSIKVQAGEYAWKPVIVDIIRRQNGGIVIWSDAGNIWRAPPKTILGSVRQYGIYASITCGSLKKWTHPDSLAYMEIDDPAILRGTMRAASCIGFDTDNPVIASLIKRWSQLAQVKECIAPKGSSKKTGHRQDQSLLTALILQAGLGDVLRKDRIEWVVRRDCPEDRRKKHNLR